MMYSKKGGRRMVAIGIAGVENPIQKVPNPKPATSLQTDKPRFADAGSKMASGNPKSSTKQSLTVLLASGPSWVS
jgi:hypothetical protein